MISITVDILDHKKKNIRNNIIINFPVESEE